MATVYKRGGKSRRGGRYYISYFDHRGQRITRSARTTDKAAAERIAAKLEADAALRRDGVVDPTLDAISKEAARTVESHLIDFEAKLRTANRSENHVLRTVGFIRQVSNWASWQRVSDVAADAVNRYAANLQAAGKSARTIQSHLTAIKAFTKWLSDNHKLPRNPLSSVKKPNPKADRRYERRMLLPEEWPWLKKATEKGPVRFGISGADRSLLYETAIQTGLRSSELRSLTRARMAIDENPPYITCKSGSTKNHQNARQYVQRELAEKFRRHLDAGNSGEEIFRLPHETNIAKMIRADLAEAKLLWLKVAKKNAMELQRRKQSDFLNDRNHDGQRFDFHCLRHTCGAWLALAGVHPKVVQV